MKEKELHPQNINLDVLIDQGIISLYCKLLTINVKKYIDYVKKANYYIVNKKPLKEIPPELQDLILYLDEIIHFGEQIFDSNFANKFSKLRECKKQVDELLLNTSSDSIGAMDQIRNFSISLMGLFDYIEFRKNQIAIFEPQSKYKKKIKKTEKNIYLNTRELIMSQATFFLYFFVGIIHFRATPFYIIWGMEILNLLDILNKPGTKNDLIEDLFYALCCCVSEIDTITHHKSKISAILDTISTVRCNKKKYDQKTVLPRAMISELTNKLEDLKNKPLHAKNLDQVKNVLNTISEIFMEQTRETTYSMHHELIRTFLVEQFNNITSLFDGYVFDLYVKSIMSAYLHDDLIKIALYVKDYRNNKIFDFKQFIDAIDRVERMLKVIREIIDKDSLSTFDEFLSLLNELKNAKSYELRFEFYPIILETVYEFQRNLLLYMRLSREYRQITEEIALKKIYDPM